MTGDRATRVWVVLVTLTVLAAVLAPGDTASGSGAEFAAAAALALGVVKARWVALDFMELREAPRWLRAAAEAWCAVVGTTLVALLVLGG